MISRYFKLNFLVSVTSMGSLKIRFTDLSELFCFVFYFNHILEDSYTRTLILSEDPNISRLHTPFIFYFFKSDQSHSLLHKVKHLTESNIIKSFTPDGDSCPPSN